MESPFTESELQDFKQQSGGRKRHSPEARAKMRAKATGSKGHSLETRAKMSAIASKLLSTPKMRKKITDGMREQIMSLLSETQVKAIEEHMQWLKNQ